MVNYSAHLSAFLGLFVHTYSRQFAPPFLSFPAYVHVCQCATPASLSQCNIGARQSRCEGCIWLSPAQRVPLRLLSRVEQLSRLLRRTGRVRRCGPRTCPCESLPGARSLAAHSAVQWLPVTLPLRPSLPWPQLRPHSPSLEPLALGSTCLYAIAPACLTPGMWSWRLKRSMCFSARAGTA